MNLRQISIREESDLRRMLALVHEDLGANLHGIDLPYRLCSWALDDPKNTCIWENDEGEILAWAVLQTPFWTIDLACRPGIENQLYIRILDWADSRIRQTLNGPYGHPAWFMNIFPDQQEHIQSLESAGFSDQAYVSEDPWSKVILVRPLGSLSPTPPLPVRYQIRPLAGENEAAAYVELHRQAFESRNMTLEWRKRILTHPAYRPELDLVIEAPQGRLAAFCIGWFDPAGFRGMPCGQIEPLGVHPDFRRLGLGRAILQEALLRLYKCSALDIYVETDNYRNAAFDLYTAAGFSLYKKVHVFRKDYGL